MSQELLKHEAYIALGSNLGNLEDNLKKYHNTNNLKLTNLSPEFSRLFFMVCNDIFKCYD